jgi:hypothetical protein
MSRRRHTIPELLCCMIAGWSRQSLPVMLKHGWQIRVGD